MTGRDTLGREVHYVGRGGPERADATLESIYDVIVKQATVWTDGEPSGLLQLARWLDGQAAFRAALEADHADLSFGFYLTLQPGIVRPSTEISLPGVYGAVYWLTVARAMNGGWWLEIRGPVTAD